ncbi:MAG: carbohydrate ABC transporter permease [Rubrivivax sp.]
MTRGRGALRLGWPQRALAYAALALALLQAVGPIAWVLSGSLKDRASFYAEPWGWPGALALRNYADAWSTARVGEHALNSIAVVGLGLFVLLAAASTTAYALARYRFPGRDAVTLLILLTMMVPPDILTIPLFIVLRTLGLLGSHLGLACIYAAAGFGMSVFLLRAYFVAVPVEVEEAARLDGARPLQVLWHVVLPMALPGFLSVVIIQAMGMWNDLYLAFVFLRDPQRATVPLGLLNFFQRDSVDWPQLLAALSMLTLPVLVLFAAFQRRFVEGFTVGAVK